MTRRKTSANTDDAMSASIRELIGHVHELADAHRDFAVATERVFGELQLTLQRLSRPPRR